MNTYVGFSVDMAAILYILVFIVDEIEEKLFTFFRMRSVGKLFGGNQAAVMAMAVCYSGSTGSSCVATGSKDKCIKVKCIPSFPLCSLLLGFGALSVYYY